MHLHGKRKFLLAFTLLFFIALFAGGHFGYLPSMLLPVYTFMSVVTFLVYALDKSKAKRNVWRIKESTLQILSLLCGWPGGVLAQEFLRHKSIKGKFRGVFYFVSLLNLCVMGLYIYIEHFYQRF
jgi:uncharacterized membrane protein YsdA (DUF1294 family)